MNTYIYDWRQHQQLDRVLVRSLYDGSIIYRGEWIGELSPHVDDDPEEEYYGIDGGHYTDEPHTFGQCCILHRWKSEDDLFFGRNNPIPVSVELDLAL